MINKNKFKRFLDKTFWEETLYNETIMNDFIKTLIINNGKNDISLTRKIRHYTYMIIFFIYIICGFFGFIKCWSHSIYNYNNYYDYQKK